MALMLTKLGSKSLAANNYRINEDPGNNGLGYCGKHMHVNMRKDTHAKCVFGLIVHAGREWPAARVSRWANLSLFFCFGSRFTKDEN